MKTLRILFLTVVSIALCTFGTLYAREHKLDEHIAAEFGMEFAQSYLEASLAHDEMWVLFPRSGEGELIYPEYYGGHFFCENGKFNLKIVCSLMAEADSGVFAEVIKMDSVEVRLVDFSHKELIATLDVVCRYIANNPENKLKIVAWGIDTPSNMVVVQVQEYSEDVASAFRHDVIDSPMVKLEKGNAVGTLIPRMYMCLEMNVTADSGEITHFKPGARIYIGESGFSTGYPAKRGQQNGFVTALHGLPLEELGVRLNKLKGPIVGDVTEPIRFQGSVDGAFISLSQPVLDQTVDNRRLLRSDMRPAHGMILTTVSTPPDGVTRTQRNIMVTNSHFRADFGGGLVLADMIQTNGYALYGESGGIVFRPIGDDAQVKGVIVGSDLDSVKGDNMFFAWSEDINRAINVTQP